MRVCMGRGSHRLHLSTPSILDLNRRPRCALALACCRGEEGGKVRMSCQTCSMIVRAALPKAVHRASTLPALQVQPTSRNSPTAPIRKPKNSTPAVKALATINPP
jgi:hypothetical protein